MNSKKIINLKIRYEKYIKALQKPNIKLNSRFRIQELLNNVFNKITSEQEKFLEKQKKKIKKDKSDIIDREFKQMYKKFKKLESKISKQNKKIEKKEKLLEAKFNLSLGVDYFIDVTLYKVYVPDDNEGNIKQIKRNWMFQVDSIGNEYTIFKNEFRYQIINHEITDFKIDKFYNEVDNKMDLEKFKRLYSQSSEINNRENLLVFEYLITGFTIQNISSLKKVKTYVKPDLMNLKFFNDDDKKGIYCKYTKYEINKEATNFKDLIVVNITNDYLKNNYRKNCCMLTSIINKFYNRFESRKADGKRRYKELTYDFLCEFLKLKNEPNNIGCTINQALSFFEKYKLGFSMYDMYMNLIFKYQPEDYKTIKNYSNLKVMNKDDHIYELNANLKSLEQLVKKDEIKINVSDKYNIFENNTEEIYKIHVINDIQDIVNYIKLYSNDEKKEIKLKLITNNDISKILIDLFNNGYCPKAFYNQIIYKLNLVIDYIFISIEAMDISTQDETPINIESVEEYNNYHKIKNQFNEKIISKEYLSYYHESVIDIEDTYKINPSCGYFDTKINKPMTTLDQRKAYTDSLMKISKVPIFNYFDVYKKYNNEDIEDYNYYIVEVLENTNKASLIFKDKYSRIYGFVLKVIDISYKILYYRKPFKLVDVDFKTPIEELYNSNEIDTDKKKSICNTLTGLLEINSNKNHQTKFFDEFNHANYYSIKYGGKMVPIYTQSFIEKTIIDDETNEPKIIYENNDKVELYMVNITVKKNLINGFRPIKDIIYCMQKLNLYNVYSKLTSLNIKVYGVKTDSLFYEGNEQLIKKNFDLTNKIGCYRIETRKYLADKKIEVFNNELINFIDFQAINIKTFEDEYDTNTINKYLEEHKVIMLKGKLPGVGKTEAIKKFGKKTLFILPENTLCRDIKLSGFDSMTFNKLFSLYAGDIELKNRKTININDYEAICFDEIAKHCPDRLKRINQFIIEHPDKYIFGAGDYKQIPPINYNGSQEYLDECINIIFKKQILLIENKRLKTKEDKIRLNNLFEYIFSDDKIDLLDMCKKFNINYETDMNNIKTLNNLAYFNNRCKDINNIIHHRVLKNKTIYHEGLNIICKKHYNNKGLTLFTNYTYKIKNMNNKGLVTIHDEVDDKTYNITMSMLQESFILPYCRTIDSSQGRSLSEKMTLFDLNLNYVSREHLWVAITRCMYLNDLTIFIHSKKEVESFKLSKLKQYFNFKIDNYKKQDLKANRKWEDLKFVDVDFINNEIEKYNMKCSYCLKDLEIYLNSFGEVNSDITLDRKNNKQAHIKTNCVLCCLHCNVSKK